MLDQDLLDLLVICQQPLLSSFPVSSPKLVRPEPTSPDNSAMVAGVVAALMVALIVIIIVVVILYK